MNRKLIVVALLASAAGLTAGWVGSDLIAPAWASQKSVISVSSGADIMNKCNFDKTILYHGGSGAIFCVAK